MVSETAGLGDKVGRSVGSGCVFAAQTASRERRAQTVGVLNRGPSLACRALERALSERLCDEFQGALFFLSPPPFSLKVSLRRR